MTDSPVDLSNLRDVTGGDPEMERDLFNEFISSSQDLVEAMARHCEGNDNEAWRKAAHAFKGIALNLGAHPLSLLCKDGQDAFEQDAAFKRTLLERIRAERETVVAVLDSQF